MIASPELCYQSRAELARRSEVATSMATGNPTFFGRTHSGAVAIWEMDGSNVIASPKLAINPGPSWHAIGMGGFNGAGKSDILFQNTNGQAAIWEMDGSNVIASPKLAINPGPSWHAIGTGDFNGDGKSDILWQNTSGAVAIWEMDGANVIASPKACYQSRAELARHRNGRRRFRHPFSKHERPNHDLGNEWQYDSRRRPGRSQSWAELACDRADLTQKRRRSSH